MKGHAGERLGGEQGWWGHTLGMVDSRDRVRYSVPLVQGPLRTCATVSVGKEPPHVGKGENAACSGGSLTWTGTSLFHRTDIGTGMVCMVFLNRQDTPQAVLTQGSVRRGVKQTVGSRTVPGCSIVPMFTEYYKLAEHLVLFRPFMAGLRL